MTEICYDIAWQTKAVWFAVGIVIGVFMAWVHLYFVTKSKEE